MKRLFTTIGLVAMIIIAGCTDLDDVQRQIDELKARLKSVEQLTSNANSEITSIRALIDAVNKKLSVVSYKELADKSGYELTLSDGGKITLKHGAKGDDSITPEINVKQHSDGLLYWTINGNFLLDSNGNKVVAQGFTPQLRVNSEFHWEMSLDGGTTWQLVKDDKGNSVLAQGPKGDDGDADLTITEVGDVIIITYKGVTYTLPKGEAPVMMILTTAKNVGEKIELWIDAADEDQPHVWIDLNNNGIKESGEAVYFGDYRAYTIGTQTVTIYGKITWLECSDNDLKVLDVSNNTSLTWLNCSDNNLKLLDVSNNTSLTELYCYNNQLPALNVGNNAALTSLGCNGNLLTELDVSHNVVLEDLFCSNNQLQKLSVIENIKLRMLFCNNNQLTALDVSNNPNLCNLRCYNNKISGDNMIALVNSLPIRTAGDEGIFRVIDLTNPEEQNVCTTAQVGIATGKNWKVLNSDGDPYGGSGAPPPGHYMTLTTAKNVGEKIELWIDAAPADRAYVWIDLNNNGNKDNGEAVTTFEEFVEYTLGAQTVTVYGKVTELRCTSNNLTSLDVRHNTALTSLLCRNNHLTSLDVSKNTELTHLFCYGNQLTSLDVSKNTALTVLSCGFNPLKALDVSHNKALTLLDCSENELSVLDVSNNTALTSLDCRDNQLATIDVNSNTALTDLNCSNNQLTALNVSHNTALRELKCFLNKISGDNMTALVNNLPIRTAGNQGIFCVIALGDPDEQNVCTTAQVDIATGKNWIVWDADDNPYPGS